MARLFFISLILFSTSSFARYEAKVLPILQRKCTACHSASPDRPFFYNLPLVGHWTRSYVDNKIQAALASFEIVATLEGAEEGMVSLYATKILKALEENRMPPPAYLLLHPESRVSEAELKEITEWASGDKG